MEAHSSASRILHRIDAVIICVIFVMDKSGFSLTEKSQSAPRVAALPEAA
jgi:hypothetical protein